VLGALVGLVLVPLLLVGCGGDDAEESESEAEEGQAEPVDVEQLPGQAEVAVDVADNSFTPPNIGVDTGTEVTWTNTGRNEHNVTPSEEGQFEASDDLAQGDTYSVTFDEPGFYPYYCTIHATPTTGQIGSVTVVDAGGGS